MSEEKPKGIHVDQRRLGRRFLDLVNARDAADFAILRPRHAQQPEPLDPASPRGRLHAYLTAMGVLPR